MYLLSLATTMSYQVRLSAQGEADICKIYQYILEHGPANPDAWKAGLEEKLAILEQSPETCGFAPENEYTDAAVRQKLYGPFRILFVIAEKTVHVLTVRHGARRFLTQDEFTELD